MIYFYSPVVADVSGEFSGSGEVGGQGGDRQRGDGLDLPAGATGGDPFGEDDLGGMRERQAGGGFEDSRDASLGAAVAFPDSSNPTSACSQFMALTASKSFG